MAVLPASFAQAQGRRSGDVRRLGRPRYLKKVGFLRGIVDKMTTQQSLKVDDLVRHKDSTAGVTARVAIVIDLDLDEHERIQVQTEPSSDPHLWRVNLLERIVLNVGDVVRNLSTDERGVVTVPPQEMLVVDGYRQVMVRRETHGASGGWEVATMATVDRAWRALCEALGLRR